MRTIAKMTYLRWWKHLPTEILDFYYRVVYRITEAYKRFFFAPIYYEYWSRDCDMCESAGVDIFYGGRKAYDKAYQKAGEWAEGPFSWNIITKAEYEQRKDERYFRDRIMEAYENGNGTSIYV